MAHRITHFRNARSLMIWFNFLSFDCLKGFILWKLLLKNQAELMNQGTCDSKATCIQQRATCWFLKCSQSLTIWEPANAVFHPLHGRYQRTPLSNVEHPPLSLVSVKMVYRRVALFFGKVHQLLVFLASFMRQGCSLFTELYAVKYSPVSFQPLNIFNVYHTYLIFKTHFKVSVS